MILGFVSVEIVPERVTADEKTNGRKLVLRSPAHGYEQRFTDPDELDTLIAEFQREAVRWRHEREAKP